MKKLFMFLGAICLVLAVALPASAYTFYTDRSAWEAEFGSFIETSEYGTTGTTLTAGTGIDVGYGESLSFEEDLAIRTIGSGWATWSGTYAGDVLFQQAVEADGTSQITGDFTPGVLAGFGLEAEPEAFDTFDILLRVEGGGLLQAVEGYAGASFFGWSLDAGDIPVVQMTLTSSEGAGGFAIGRMVSAASVPEPATMLLLGTGLFGLAGLGRKKFFKKG